EHATAELDYAAALGLKSHLMLPLSLGGANLGALAFGSFRDYRTWPDELVNRLQLVARVFGNALARKRARELLEERLGFERLVADLVQDLFNVQAAELDALITHALEGLIGRFGIDRCALGRFSDDGSLSFTHSARAEGIPPLPARIDFPWYVGQLRQGQTIRFDQLPGERSMAPAPALEFARATGIRSHLAIPLVTAGGVWGMIGFAAFHQPRMWTEEEVPRLALVGE